MFGPVRCLCGRFMTLAWASCSACEVEERFVCYHCGRRAVILGPPGRQPLAEFENEDWPPLVRRGRCWVPARVGVKQPPRVRYGAPGPRKLERREPRPLPEVPPEEVARIRELLEVDPVAAYLAALRALKNLQAEG